MQSKYFLIAVLFLSSNFIGCESPTSDLEQCQSNENGFYPLALKNNWVYLVSSIDKNNFVHLDTSSIIITEVKNMVDNNCWYLSEEGASVNVVGRRKWYAVRETGLVWVTGAGGAFESIHLIYKYPCRIGDIYQGQGANERYRVMATDTLITVPAGTFRCIYYKNIYRNSYPYDYFVSDGIGLIKKMMVGGSNSWELLDYTLYE